LEEVASWIKVFEVVGSEKRQKFLWWLFWLVNFGRVSWPRRLRKLVLAGLIE
jgi:hypothetical protein